MKRLKRLGCFFTHDTVMVTVLAIYFTLNALDGTESGWRHVITTALAILFTGLTLFEIYKKTKS